jgi:hypothetical protein
MISAAVFPHPKFDRNILCSPVIKLLDPGNDSKTWNVSILIASKKEGPKKFACNKARNLQHRVLAHHNCAVESFQLTIDRGNRNKEVEYSIHDRTFSIMVPGKNTPTKMAFFTCNGFHSHDNEIKLGGIHKMWENYALVNQSSRPPLLLFGGDQEYFDPVFETPSLKKWLLLGGQEKLDHPFTEEMRKEVEEFYFQRYIEKFAVGKPFANALSGAASIMNWDDHDIFDGWGSYSKELQACPVFQGVYQAAKYGYLLFQQQVDPTHPFATGAFIGDKSYSILRVLDDCAILAPDTRSQRTQHQILSEKGWKEIFDKCETLPDTCRHLFAILPIPIIFPDLSHLGSLVDKAELDRYFLTKIIDILKSPNLKNQILSPYGTVDIQDDIIDEWRNKRHLEERKMVIQHLQNFAERTGRRVTILTGDVHLWGTGEFHDPHVQDKQRDPRYMVEVISSPMGNMPTGKLMAIFLSHLNNKTEVFDEHTYGKLIPIRRKDSHGEKILSSKRNWAQLAYNPETKGFTVNFYVESKKVQLGTDAPVRIYETTIPALLVKSGHSSNLQGLSNYKTSS